MKITIGEFVGGHADGVQMDPSDIEEPDDWPDQISVTDNETGATSRYFIRKHEATIRGEERVYFFDHEDLMPDE